EFGRAWMMANIITHAARDGARAAALIPAARRSAGVISGTDADNIKDQVATFIAAAVEPLTSTITANDVSVVQAVDDAGIPTVAVTVTGSVPFVFNLWGTGFEVGRTATFRDQGA